MPATDRRKLNAAKRRFTMFYPGGFHDEDYVVMERRYKWEAHRAWAEAIGRPTPASLSRAGAASAIAAAAVRIESRTNLLFSFEKMAIRDAVSSPAGARDFASGLVDWLDGSGPESAKFPRWCETLRALPRRQTRVATWPVATVFGFIARPRTHIFLKPTVTRVAAERYGYPFEYRSAVGWDTYSSLLGFARTIRRDLADWRPRDMIDIRSFIWVLGSGEYD
jgi:hypothetical protein